VLDGERSEDDIRGSSSGSSASGTEGADGEGLAGAATSGEGGVRLGTQDDGPGADAPAPDVAVPTGATAYTPLFRAQNEGRYLRRELIRAYEARHNCRLIVMIDQIDPMSVTYFAELLHQADPRQDLHLMIWSPGGDGETAVRLARMAQDSCRKFVLLVPDFAKSAATILGLAAHQIVMGPTSDLGPIDPQVLIGGRGYVSAKDLIAAVDVALTDVAARPDTFPLHAAMLGGIDETQVQFARSALARTDELAKQALSSQPDRTEEDVLTLFTSVSGELITTPNTHGAVVGSVEADRAGLPVISLSPGDQW